MAWALIAVAALTACNDGDGEQARESFEQGADHLREAVEDVGSAARETVESAARKTEDAMEEVGEAARDTLDTAQEKTHELREEQKARSEND